MVLIIAGLAWTALCIFAAVATGWFVFVLGSLLAGAGERGGDEMGCRDTG